MQQEIVSLVSGAVVGLLFGIAGAAVPAPPNIAGLLGIVGITVGYSAIALVRS